MIFLSCSWSPKTHLARDPWLPFQIYGTAPTLRKTPCEELESCNVVPGQTACTGCRNSRPAATGFGRRRCPEYLGGSHVSIWGGFRAGLAAGELPQRGASAAPTGAQRAGVPGVDAGYRATGKVAWGLGEGEKWLGRQIGSGAGTAAVPAALVSGGRRFWHPVALEDGHAGVVVLLGASARVCFDVGVVKCAAWPAGHACMRAMRAADACDGVWPGGPATSPWICAWARRSGPGVGRSARGGAGPPRSPRETVHRRRGARHVATRPGAAPRSRAQVRASAGAGASFHFVEPSSNLRNSKKCQLTSKSPKIKVVEEL
jgi:hypothetical protein